MRPTRVVEIGASDGQLLLREALLHPEREHLGIERLLHPVRRAEARSAGVPNLRFLHGDAVAWLREAPHGSLDLLLCYHPQPYLDPEEAPLGLLTPGFFAMVRERLRPTGCFVLQTDSPPFGRYLLQAANRCFEAEIQEGPWPDAPEGRTPRERTAMRKGLAVLRVTLRPREIPLDTSDPPPWHERAGLKRVRARGRA